MPAARGVVWRSRAERMAAATEPTTRSSKTSGSSCSGDGEAVRLASACAAAIKTGSSRRGVFSPRATRSSRTASRLSSRTAMRSRLPGWDRRAVHTPGHSPGHLCFHEHQRRVLFSGDHVLPRITPNIGVHAKSSGNPLADFVDCLARAGGLDHDLDEVLPAHEYRLAGLAARVSTLLNHHDERLEEIHAALTTTPTTWELTGALT